MPTLNLGRVGFVNKGAYIGGTTAYKINDIVVYNNAIYACILAHNTSHLPTDTLYWQKWTGYDASGIVNTPAGDVVATDVQAAINELDTKKQAIAPNYTGVKSGNLASASTVNIGAAMGDFIHITGTTTITAFDVAVAGLHRILVFDGILTLTHNATSLILPGSANITTSAKDVAIFVSEGSGNWRCIAYQYSSGSYALLGNNQTFSGINTFTQSPIIPTPTANFQAATKLYADARGTRQSVQSSSVDTNGYANFISVGTGLSVNIAATTTPIAIHAAGGILSSDRKGFILADTTISSLTANTTNYLYADISTDGTCTLGFTTTAPLYQFGGTPSTTNAKFTFNIGEMKGYVGNGTTAPQSWRVQIGEAVTNATDVTTVVNYALNGIYDSGYTATLPASGSLISKNSNIGTTANVATFLAIFTTAEAGYSIGDIITPLSSVGSFASIQRPTVTNNTVSITVGSSGWSTFNKTTGASAGVTNANLSWKIIVNRGW